MATEGKKVYKNEDVNNPEYVTFEEVQRAFFGRGVFIKETGGIYAQVTKFSPNSGFLYTQNNSYSLAVPK